MTDDRRATGVPEVILVNLLLGLDVEWDRIAAMSNEERLASVQAAVEDGRLAPARLDTLREMGVLPPN